MGAGAETGAQIQKGLARDSRERQEERYLCWLLRKWCRELPMSECEWWYSDRRKQAVGYQSEYSEHSSDSSDSSEGQLEAVQRLRCSVCWRWLVVGCFPKRRRGQWTAQCKACVGVDCLWGSTNKALARACHHLLASWWWFFRLWWRAVVEAREVVAVRRADEDSDEVGDLIVESWEELMGQQCCDY